MLRLVLDTSVLVAGLRSRRGASSALLVLVAERRVKPLATTSLFLEYEEVLLRAEQRLATGMSEADVTGFLAALASATEGVEVHFQWRPQLGDPADEMVLEAAINGQADALADAADQRRFDDHHAAHLPRVRAGQPQQRQVAAAIEAGHDERGIIWPRELAPYDVHLVGLGFDKPGVRESAEQVYQQLQDAGFEVLYDDREEGSAGVKFNDADLLGMPVRVTVSPRSIENGGAEVKRRTEKDGKVVPLDGASGAVRELLA